MSFIENVILNYTRYTCLMLQNVQTTYVPQQLRLEYHLKLWLSEFLMSEQHHTQEEVQSFHCCTYLSVHHTVHYHQKFYLLYLYLKGLQAVHRQFRLKNRDYRSTVHCFKLLISITVRTAKTEYALLSYIHIIYISLMLVFIDTYYL